MNKKTKTAIAVGVVAVAGYLIYRQSQKKSFANLTRTRMSTLSTFGAAPTESAFREKCITSPADAASNQVIYNGITYFPCCGKGVFGKQMGTQPCPNKTMSTTT
jgi:hypothetical protein